MTEDIKYSRISRFLHWLVAGLIVSQYVLAELAEQAEHNDKVVQQLGLLANHKSIGMTILMLALIRLCWRLIHKPPALPNSMPAWQMRASSISHWIMYGLIFAIPVSGWLMSSAAAYSVSWFNLFVFPDLVSSSDHLEHLFHDVHEILVKSLFVIVVVHIAAALKHHFVDKDAVMARMASKGAWLLFLSIIVFVLGLFGRITITESENVRFEIQEPVLTTESLTPKSSTPDNSIFEKSITSHNIESWVINYQDSFIKFSGDQAGAPFEGQWQAWNADIKFDASNLSQSSFDVTIESNSVFTEDQERDDTIASPDFFNADAYPNVKFLANKFDETKADNFSTSGILTMKGFSKPAILEFSIVENEDTITLIGKALLDRFTWNIGMGDWTDTSWVGKDVAVEVRIIATK